MTNKEIIKNLESVKEDVLIETLKVVTTQGNNEILKHVIKLLDKSDSTLVRDKVILILENLKEQNSSQVIIDSIKDSKTTNELSILVSACWKNGLNYEKYLDVFIDVFIQSDFQIAFDAFTVIDTFEKVDINIANINIIKLENAIEDSPDDKKALFSELINILHDLKENPAN